MSKIAVTGASGFVGRNVVKALVSAGHEARAIVRTEGTASDGAEEVVLGDFTLSPNWVEALTGQHAVVCLAARVHVMHETAEDPLTEFEKINVEVTRQIAEAAVEAGVRRLVFVSSIKVNGEGTRPNRPFRADDPVAPQDPYAVSKYRAETTLRRIAADTPLRVVIIRPPLVYGPGVGGNFLRLLHLAQTRLPLPFGLISNKRAMIAVENLADAILAACTKALEDDVTVLLVNDQNSISTSQLLRTLSTYLGKRSTMIPVPPIFVSAGMALLGKRAEADRLLGSLEVEVSSDPAGFDWRPLYPTEQALKRTAEWFRGGAGHS